MKTLAYCLVACLALPALGQTVDPFSEAYARYLMGTLAADSLEGRDSRRPSIEKATRFLEAEMKAIGLRPLPGHTGYRHPAYLLQRTVTGAQAQVGTQQLGAGRVAFARTRQQARVEGVVGSAEVALRSVSATTWAAFVAEVERGALTAPITLVKTAVPDRIEGLCTATQRIRRYQSYNPTAGPQVVVFVDAYPPTGTTVVVEADVDDAPLHLTNLVGYLPGSSRPEEYIYLSGHYDHVGIGRPNAESDSIYNGANDDASGTTATLMLARHYASLPQAPARSLVFACWSGEELGLLGSTYFAERTDPKPIVAMLSLEMLGMPWKYGPGSLYMSGFGYSDLGRLFQAHAPADSSFRLYPDPYVGQNFFARSDNYGFARVGIPAHMLISADFDDPALEYHRPNDELERMNLPHFVAIVRGIHAALAPLVAGQITPRRLSEAVVQELRGLR